jgi:hypothetical protein
VHPWIWTVILLCLLSLLPSLALAQPLPYDRSAPTLSGLVAWWIGQPGFVGGLRWYEQTGRFPGTLTGGPTWAVSTRQYGRYALRFDGTNDYVSVAAHTSLEPPQRTTMFWMRGGALGDYQGLVGAQHATHYFNTFVRYVSSNGYIAVYFKMTSGDNALDTSAGLTVPLGVWTHVAVTGGNGFVRTYLNCQFNQSVTSSGTLVASPSAALLFGASGSPIANWYNGTLDDVRIYARVLSPQEICAAMREPPPLVVAQTPPAWLPAAAAGAAGSFLPFFAPAQ